METKLWQKPASQNPQWLEDFTIGNDRTLDLLLAEHDVIASMAHASMLAKSGLISENDNILLQQELKNIFQSIKNGFFVIDPKVEDVHSQIELLLTKKLGDVGKKIHTARSRNDQVLTAIKLFVRAELKNTAGNMKSLFDLLQSLSEKNKHILMPGYTHMQIAMPSSFGLWFGAYAESLSEDIELLLAAFEVANKNPLGSGAGYGSSLPIDRKSTTKEMQFGSMNYNVVYAQMTRGKTEKIAAIALAGIASTLSKLASDICLFISQNFNFISFPEELTTGSSIMPHKKNPDVFELIRAKCNRVQALPNELTLLTSNLPSGYHRDLQLTKECLFPAFKSINDCLKTATHTLQHIRVNQNILDDEKYQHLFSVEKVNYLVKKGIPFRDAYKKVGAEIRSGEFSYEGEVDHYHEGSMGNLMTEQVRNEFYLKLGRLGLA